MSTEYQEIASRTATLTRADLDYSFADPDYSLATASDTVAIGDRDYDLANSVHPMPAQQMLQLANCDYELASSSDPRQETIRLGDRDYDMATSFGVPEPQAAVYDHASPYGVDLGSDYARASSTDPAPPPIDSASHSRLDSASPGYFSAGF